MKFEALIKNYDTLNNGKRELISNWMSNRDVLKIFKKHNIDLAFFIKEYAIKVINYYLEVILGNAKIEDCPVDGKLMQFLSSKDVRSEEFFMLCSGVRKSFENFTYKHNFFSEEIEQEINYIYTNNFYGVLQHYTAHQNELENRLKQSIEIEDQYIIKSSFDTDGKITNVSKAYCEISGYTKQEIIGRDYNILADDDATIEILFGMWNTISNGNVWRGETKNRKKDGGYYWIDTTIAPIIVDGNILQFSTIARDITDKKELIEQQNLIVEQSKSAAMGEMISMIAHQWRQPLQTISILAQKISITMMTDGNVTAELVDKVVDDIGVQLSYMSKTIDDFRDFFKPNKKAEQIHLTEIIAKASTFLEMMFKTEAIEFSKEIKDDAIVNVYVNEIVQVFINIFKNARDAMTETKVLDKKIALRIFLENNHAIIEIEDNGGGIPQKAMNKIFEPYFSTKTSKNGTGLGLYMCKTIIEQHSNGKLLAKNGNNGAIFRIELPLFK